MRIDWKNVGPICEHVYDRLDAEAGGRFDSLVRIGIDKTSYKKGHRYMTVVLDHDARRVIWFTKRHGKAALESCFSLLSERQHVSIEVVITDGARMIADVAGTRRPNAERVKDPFRVVSWVNGALGGVHRGTWREAGATESVMLERRGCGRPGKVDGPVPSRAKALKGGGSAVLKNPEGLARGAQQVALESVPRESSPLQ